MDEVERAAFHPEFERALGFATGLHSSQTRKGTDIPYISHLIGVAGLVLEHGGGRDETIAALLHDSIEDCGADYPGGVAALRARIASAFGPQVLEIVEGCTDADTVPKPPWRDRKERYVAHVREASASVRRVSCADKLHNARAIVSDLRVMGPAVFDRFTGGRDGTLWYYEALAKVFEARGPADLAGELRRTVEVMNQLSSAESMGGAGISTVESMNSPQEPLSGALATAQYFEVEGQPAMVVARAGFAAQRTADGRWSEVLPAAIEGRGRIITRDEFSKLRSRGQDLGASLVDNLNLNVLLEARGLIKAPP